MIRLGVDARQRLELVERRRRTERPLERRRTLTPRISRSALTAAGRLEQDEEEQQQAGKGDVVADRRHAVPHRIGIGIVDVATRHAAEAEEVLREEDEV